MITVIIIDTYSLKLKQLIPKMLKLLEMNIDKKLKFERMNFK